MTSMQKKLRYVRKPRVQIEYELETGGAIVMTELPCVLGLIADLTGHTISKKKYKNRKFINVDADNLYDIMESLCPSIDIQLQLQISKAISSQKDIPINMNYKFKCINDFNPDHFIKKIPELQEFYHRSQVLSSLITHLQNNDELYVAFSKFVNNGDTASKSIEAIKLDSSMLKSMEEMFDEGKKIGAKSFKDLQSIRYKMNQVLSEALDNILHISDLQILEGKWRGIEYIIKNLSLGTSLQFKVFNATQTELHDDLDSAMDFDQSALFKKVYEEEYGTYGGNPYSFIAADYNITKSAPDMNLLRKFSGVMACAHIPSIMGASSKLFGLESFQDLNKIRDYEKLFSSIEYAEFNSIRSSDDSRYVGLAALRIMSRLPYGPNTIPSKEFPNYMENVLSSSRFNSTTDNNEVPKDNKKKDNKDAKGTQKSSASKEIRSAHDLYCWHSSIYYILFCVGRSFFYHGWFSAIIGCNNGGMIESLPLFMIQNDDNEMIMKCPTETFLTERTEASLSSLGFIIPCPHKASNHMVFFSMKSMNKPARYSTPEANTNAELSRGFQYMINVSRFAHYMKVMIRNMIGSPSNITSIQQYLSGWISQYVLLNDTTDLALNAKYPLKGAKVTVADHPGRPGYYLAIVHIKPSFQLEGIQISLRLVGKLPSDGEVTSIMEREALLAN